ncbi:DUF1592 domain-containing protein [Telmatocola sphagniphila]|uniref:DUF1592 domain-containing protein n=1 Tax=Telmatocola sphagniphila TaxID=1123043 RepID=A0A8E6B981_9BACT|nr:DUF1592 domain-containing protein [Telmatocola sphagniphila]QVL34197.1 DUF1592 domain-containing protein [Telmatocola sphagniphila]
MFRWQLTTLLFFLSFAFASAEQPTEFFTKHCYSCHGPEAPAAGLDLTSFKKDLGKPENFSKWVKIFDRIDSGEMPPAKKPRPETVEKTTATKWLKAELLKAELQSLKDQPRTGLRRLTRAEYENTMRDLFAMPGIALQDDLPADGSAHGFDKNSEALDISHVNLAKYLEAADHVLDMAIATQALPPARKVQRVTMANESSTLAACILEGDGVMLKNKNPDPDYPPAGYHKHLDYPAHLMLGMHTDVSPGSSVGIFRHEDDSFRPSFVEFTTIYPGMYRVKTAFWSFRWDKGKVLPTDRVEVARLDVWHITGDGRGTGHPSTLLGYFDAPSLKEQTYEFNMWLNPADSFGFNFTTSNVGHEIRGTKGRLMNWSGPGLACDGLEVEGPIYDKWPPESHRRLFGDLPILEFKPEKNPGIHPPRHKEWNQRFNAKNHPDPQLHTLKLCTVTSGSPLADADRLIGNFLPKAFRRPVSDETRRSYLALFEKRLKSGDCFETALRTTYRAALCSPNFLYHVEEGSPTVSTAALKTGREPIEDYSLASRLSYFFWNSMPDEKLVALAASKRLHQPEVLSSEVERLLKDPKSKQFREDFLGQWLKLRKIAANDPDPKLYGGWRIALQDAMVAETNAYFKELIDKDLCAKYLIKSDFAMLNERLAKHYGISGVVGSQMRRVPVAADCPRGPFLTQAAILKITANGTTTSPVPRGAFVMDRLLGQPPEPPPPNVPAVEPDVRGATTVREQLAKHRDNATCASCHAKIDPAGLALESFDVIGGQRTRYQSITQTKPPVDPSGQLPDGRKFKDILELQNLLLTDSDKLLKNLAQQFAVYSIGRGMTFSDRNAIEAIVEKTKQKGGGIRTLLHELVASELFQSH